MDGVVDGVVDSIEQEEEVVAGFEGDVAMMLLLLMVKMMMNDER